ncbi:MAG: zinc-dependent metalloprotease [Planctomycetota bacterium]
MNPRHFPRVWSFALACCLLPTMAAWAEEDKEKGKPKYPPLAELTEDLKPIDGVLKLYLGETKLLAEIKPGDLDQDFLVLITIARGIGETPLLGGYSWGFGDDWVWQFRKRGERIHLVRRNVRFRAEPGSPSEKAVRLAYTDSVLFSLPIAGRGEGGSYVVDLAKVFFSDLPQISQVLSGYSFSKEKSTWAEVDGEVQVKGFPQNLEAQVAATYQSPGADYSDTVPDTRGVTINVHYSVSKLPKSDYKPRLADDRVGYFLTAVKDFSKDGADDQFVRYINRWNLQKSDPNAEKSPPKEPIVFWLEKTIPYKYRKPIRDGIEEWNKAFEKAGFYNAIDVRQQPDDADWEPGDVRYNTFRWITAGAGFAMGPSRVNPLTGEILDADIIFDSDFLQYWRREYETITPEAIAAMTGGPLTLEAYRAQQRQLGPFAQHGLATQHGHGRCSCNLLGGMSHQLARGAAAIAGRKSSAEDEEKFIMQGLKDVAMHEVGHTLGLRHNFKASTLYGMDEANDVSKTSKTGLTASVMDYTPANIALSSDEQGDYYSTTIGPYDYWAIEYGYTPLDDEEGGLAKIASRSGEPGLAYGTDGDTRGIDPDPHCYRFDFGNDLLEYARHEAALVAQTLPGIVDNLVGEGEGYQRARRAFGVMISTHGRAMFAASRYIDGVYVSRSHKGDPDADDPFTPVTAQKQRDTLKLLAAQMFSDGPFDIPPTLYNQLLASRWSHWGTDLVDRHDYPVHQIILRWQERVLDQLMSPLTLTRLHDGELKTPADEDAFTCAELLTGVREAVFASVAGIDKAAEYTPRKPAVSSLDRNLQRAYLERLIRLSLRNSSAPQDCQTLAYLELERLRSSINPKIAPTVKLDDYTRAHLRETKAQIDRALDARMIALP